MDSTDTTTADRGQAYTLEGFIGAMVVLMAVLFALQSIVITPTTGGSADRAVQAQLQQEAQDALVVSDHDGNLSETSRNWDASGEHFRGTNGSLIAPNGNRTYNATAFANQSRLGAILEDRFAESGYSYNVELVYESETESEFNTTYLVYQGSPSSTAVTASYVLTLYEDDTLTADEDDSTDLPDARANGYPIPDAADTESVYNVVEVRVTVW